MIIEVMANSFSTTGHINFNRVLFVLFKVFWSDSGELCCIATEDSFFILKYNQEAVTRAIENKDELVTEDGVEDAFEVNRAKLEFVC